MISLASAASSIERFICSDIERDVNGRRDRDRLTSSRSTSRSPQPGCGWTPVSEGLYWMDG